MVESKPSPSRPLHHRLVQTVAAGVGRGVEWLGRHELHVLATALVLVLAVWFFVALADEVVEGQAQRIDERVLLALRRPGQPSQPIGPDWLHNAVRDFSALGGMPVLLLFILAVVGFLLIRRTYHAMWLILIATGGGLSLSALLKSFFDRPRPEVVSHLDWAWSGSFPSGHSMMATVVYLTLGALLGRVVDGWRLKAYFLLVALILALLVGFSRVYLGVHYPSDVLAGWAAGLAWATFCWLVARYLQKRGAVEEHLRT